MKILMLDVETCPHLSWHFSRWNANIPPEFTEIESHIICFAAKWHKNKKIEFSSTWEDGHVEMMEHLWDLMDDADVVVGFNSKKFDVKKINMEFLKLGWEQPSPYDQIDLYQQIGKTFGPSSKKMKHVLKELGLDEKEENSGMKLWMGVMNENKKDQAKMKSYNRQDVICTEELYDRMLGWITPHPNWGLYVEDADDPENPVCPSCGERNMKKHKVRRTRTRVYQQWQCQSCGAYHKGRKNIGPVGTENGILSWRRKQRFYC